MTLSGLKYIARVSGCLVYDYSKSQEMLILYRLFDRAKRSKGVACVDNCGNKLIFIDDSLPEEQQLFVLAHELGHIVLQHDPKCSGTSQEDDANDFASVLLRVGGAV